MPLCLDVILRIRSIARDFNTIFIVNFIWNLEDVEKKISSSQEWTIPHVRGIVHRSVNLIR